MPDVTGLTRQPHSWTGLGNPQGGLVFTNAFSGSYEQLHEWTSFQSACTSFDHFPWIIWMAQASNVCGAHAAIHASGKMHGDKLTV